MSNTKLRILSAIGLIIIVGACIAFGSASSLALVGVVGLLVVDEVIINFLNFKRRHISYIISQVSFLVCFGYFNFIEPSDGFFQAFNNAGLVLDAILLFYLFAIKHESKAILNFLKTYTFVIGILLLIPFMNLASIIHFNNWVVLLVALFLLNFGVDTAAWFWGKNFGKHKLWPAVSPKKTIEGLVGGVATSVIIIWIYWISFVGNTSYQIIISFLIIACCAQLGDLIQSKMKRQFEIKDSSNLIPGHGGVYDRVDSLLFVAPLFVLVIRSFLG